MVRSASSVFVEYGYETGFGEGMGSGTTPIKFGKEVKASGLDFKNNQMPLGQLYSPEIETFAYGKNEGKVSMEYVLSNPWFFESILNKASSIGAAPTTHTWSSTPTTSSTIKQINSMALKFGFDVEAPFRKQPLGVICPSLALKMALDGTIKVTQELVWGEEGVGGITTSSSGANEATFNPYTFVHASITDPKTGNVLSTIQSFDLNINSNAELVYGFGSKISESAFRKILELTGKISIPLKNREFLEQVTGRGESDNDMVITIVNDGSGNNLREIKITLEGVSFSVHNTSGIEPGELVIENLDFQARSITVVAKNSTSDIP